MGFRWVNSLATILVLYGCIDLSRLACAAQGSSQVASQSQESRGSSDCQPCDEANVRISAVTKERDQCKEELGKVSEKPCECDVEKGVAAAVEAAKKDCDKRIGEVKEESHRQITTCKDENAEQAKACQTVFTEKNSCETKLSEHDNEVKKLKAELSKASASSKECQSMKKKVESLEDQLKRARSEMKHVADYQYLIATHQIYDKARGVLLFLKALAQLSYQSFHPKLEMIRSNANMWITTKLPPGVVKNLKANLSAIEAGAAKVSEQAVTTAKLALSFVQETIMKNKQVTTTYELIKAPVSSFATNIDARIQILMKRLLQYEPGLTTFVPQTPADRYLLFLLLVALVYLVLSVTLMVFQITFVCVLGIVKAVFLAPYFIIRGMMRKQVKKPSAKKPFKMPQPVDPVPSSTNKKDQARSKKNN